MKGNAAARHELFHALAFCTWIVVAVTLQKVNRAPNTKASAEGNNEGLENSNRFIKEIHTKYL